MNHKDILKRAWDILWSYKVLWVFGIILAITTASGGERIVEFSGNTTSPPAEPQPMPEDFEETFKEGFEEMSREMDKFFSETFPAEWMNAIVTIAIVMGCVFLILIVLSIIFQYVSRTSLIKMVDEHEETGARYGFREGFRIGWSQTAGRMFLIDILTL